jgi:uncharacterized membrane protein YdbT with pleckstrin-like domain
MRKWLFKWLKIPAEPEPPAGSHESVRVFRAAKNFYYLLLVKWGIKQISLLVGILFSLYMLDQWSRQMNETLVLVISVFEWIGVAGYLCQIPLSLALVKLDYELRWYIVTDRSLRIRSGIWDIREMTMTCANIQQASVSQGPLQRLLGISDLLVRTAGGGSGGEVEHQHQKGASELMHVAYFHGVDNAEEIKELIQERMKQFNDAGLGDPDEDDEAGAGEIAVAGPPEILLAARDFADQARALRDSLGRPASEQ